MNTLRSLILLLLVSAMASASQAHSATAVDGYQDQANAPYSLLPSQEHEGDEPEGIVTGAPGNSRLVTANCFAPVAAPATVANYSDYLARAPPHSL